MSVDQVAAEAAGQAATVTWRDRKFTVAPAETWMPRFMHWFDRDKVTLALEEMLGAEQYAEFMDARPTMSDVGALMNTIASAYGLDLGE